MSDTKALGPTALMYEAGFGTGHALDLRPIQVDLDGTIHNVLQRTTVAGSLIGATEPVPMTMCGQRLQSRDKPYPIIGEPYQAGPTTCDPCGTLAAYRIVANY